MYYIFSPLGATKSISASSSTANVALDTSLAGRNKSVRVYNDLSEKVFIKFGTSGITAATTDMPIGAGATEVFEINSSHTHVAAITASGSGTIYFTEGEGA